MHQSNEIDCWQLHTRSITLILSMIADIVFSFACDTIDINRRIRVTQEQILKRRLDNYEEWSWSIQHIAPILFDYSGKLDIEALNESYKKLSQYYPVLRAHVTGGDQHHTLEVTDQIPELKILTGPENEVAQELSSIARNLRPRIAQFAIRQRSDNGTLAFINDHTTFDAHAIYFYIQKLLEIYTEIKAGRSVTSSTKSSLPFAPSTILANRSGNQFIEATKGQDKTERVNRRWEIRRRIIPFGSAVTAKLLQTGKLNGITVGSIIAAAMSHTLLTLQDPGKKDSITVVITVDLRNNVNPPIKGHETTNLIVRRPIKIAVDQANPINTARSYMDKLKEERTTFRTTDRIYRPDVTFDEVKHSHDHPPEGDFEVNNAGKFPGLGKFGEVKFTGMGVTGLSKTEDGPIGKAVHPYRLGSWTLNDQLEVLWWGPDDNRATQKIFIDKIEDIAKLSN